MVPREFGPISAMPLIEEQIGQRADGKDHGIGERQRRYGVEDQR